MAGYTHDEILPRTDRRVVNVKVLTHPDPAR
jgi:hypothetical protein